MYRADNCIIAFKFANGFFIRSIASSKHLSIIQMAEFK